MITATGLPFSSVAYPTASQPRTVTIDDVNADSYPDLIVPSNGTNLTQIFLGTATGLYGGNPDITLVGDFNSQKAAVADFNNDGRKDIAVVFYFGGIQIWLQDPAGQFVSSTTLGVSGTGNRCVVASDLDGDGWIDLAATSEQGFSPPFLGRVTLWMGSPSGFVSGGSYTTGGLIADWVVVADLNEDGKNDLVVTNDDPSNTVSVLLNTGIAFPRLASPTQYNVGPGPNTCTTADLNGDGHVDVATADWSDVSSVSVLLGVGNGTLQPASITFPSSLQESDAFAIAAGDMTGDGRVDLVVAGGVMGTAWVMPGNGNGTFGATRLYGVGATARGVALGDVNGDGRLDIATSNLNSNTVQVLTASASGGFAGAVYPIGSDTPSSFNVDDRLAGTLAAGDVNGDGHVDLATTHATSGTASISLGAGNGSFAPPSQVSVGTNPQAVQLADLDQDGKLDLITANEGSGTVSVLLGKGDGTFKGKSNFGVGRSPWYVLAADVDRDGRTDLIAADNADNTVSVLLKNQGGGFKSRVKFPANAGPAWIAAADLNGDGFLDLVVANYNAGGFSVLYGTGTSSLFGPPTFTSVGGAARSVAVADLNLDGTPEILVANFGFARTEVWSSTGFGTYALSGFTNTWFEPRQVAAGDLDQDGHSEVLVAARVGQTFAYSGSPVPAGIRPLGFGSSGLSLVAADVNEDGRPDLVSLNSRCEAITVLLNELGGPSVFAAGSARATSPQALRDVSLFPNPMNPSGTLQFTVSKAGPLRVSLFDVQGRLVKVLLDEQAAAVGARRITVDGRDQRGASMGSGVYFYRIESQGGVVTGRFAVLK
jgi:VCBS repeat protein